MSAGRDQRSNGGPHDPESRVGRGRPARRRIVALAAGVIVIVFAVLLSIWLLGRSAADAHGAAGAGGVAHHGPEPELLVDRAARPPVEPASWAIGPPE